MKLRFYSFRTSLIYLLPIFFAAIFLLPEPEAKAQQVPELIYYQFDGSAPSDAINDASSPVGNNPAPILGSLTKGGSGQFGTGLQGSAYSSSSSYVNTGWATNLTSDWTISWYMDYQDNSSLRYVWGDNTASSFRCFYGGVAPTNGLRARGPIPDIDIPNTAQQPSVIHLVSESSSGDLKAYVNGVLVNTVSNGATAVSGSGPFKVGGYGSNDGIDGIMDEFRLYNRALSATEIAATWNIKLGGTSTAENDAGVESIDAPFDVCPDNHNVDVTIKNYGANQINSVDVHWTVDGVAQPTFTYNGLLDTANGSNPDNAQVTLGTYNFTGPAEVVAWTDNPNGVQDTMPDNDTASAVLGTINEPSNLNAVSTSSNTADISWTPGSNETNWVLEYGPSGFTPGNGTVVMTSNNPHTLTGLSGNTDYEVYVRALCGPGNYSGYVGPVSFTTLCNPFTVTYTEDFDGISSGLPDCWSEIDPGNDIHVVTSTDHGAPIPSGPNALEINDGSPTILISPILTDLPSGMNQVRVKIAFEGAGTTWTDTLFFGTLSDPNNSSTFVPIDTIIMNNTDGSFIIQTFLLNNTTLIGSNNYVAFSYATAGGGYEFFLDDFVYEPIPTCALPTSLEAINIGANSATVVWNPGNSVTNTWNIEYGPAGFSLGSGTKTTGVTDTFLNLTGLSSTTDYDFYVMEDCGGGDTSLWAGPITFTTDFLLPQPLNCAAGNSTVVFTEEFDAVNGWTGDINSGNGSWEIPGGAFSSNTGPSSAHSGASNSYTNFEASGNQSGVTADLISPAIDLSGGSSDAELSFWMHAYGDDIGTLDVGIGTSPSGPFSNVFTWSGEYQTSDTDPWVNIGVDLTPYLGQTIYIRYSYSQFSSDFHGDLSIDLVEVSTCVTCLSPSVLMASNITTNSATLSWDWGSASTNTWNVEYGPTGFAPGSGTMVTGVTDTFLNLTGLNSGFDYDFYVQENCGAGDLSFWTGPEHFSTPCLGLTGTYTIDPSQPASGTNFQTFTAAVDRLITCGISGAVVFNVAAGTYNEQITIPSITGVSLSNTITFDGVDSSMVTITSSGSPNYATVTVNGGDYVIFQNLTFENTASTDGWGIHFTNGADFNTVTNCRILLDPTASTDVIGVVASNSATSETSSGNNANNLMIKNTRIVGGEMSIHLEGNGGGSSVGDYCTDNSIINCVMELADDHSIVVDDQYSLNIIRTHTTNLRSTGADAYDLNDIVNFRVDSNFIESPDYGIDLDDGNYDISGTVGSISYNTIISGDDGLNLNDFENYQVHGNNIVSDGYGIYIFDGNVGGTITSTIINNMIVSTADRGLYLNDNHDVNVWHNTIYADDEGIYLASPTNLNIRNNIATSTADYAFYSSSTGSGDISALDYNIYYRYDGGNIAYFGSAQSDSATWLSNYSSLNNNSHFSDPGFQSTTDLHILGLLPHNNGTNLGVATDIDGQTRPLPTGTNPDIGADEYIPPTCFPPSGVSASNVTTNSANISWTSGGASDWNIEYGPSGFPLGSGTMMNTTSTTANLMGLQSGTYYDFYVRDSCGVGDVSPWIGPFTFSTLCVIASLPYMEDFSSGLFPTCWTRSSTTDVTVEASCANRSNVLEFNYKEEAITNDIDATGAQGLQVSYYIGAGACINDPEDTEHFYVDYWDGSQWVLLKDYDGTWPEAFVWESFILPQSAVSSSFKLRFDMIDGTTDSWEIDSVVVEHAPSCFTPSALSFNATSSTTADLTWTGGGASDWNVEYGPSGFAQGTGTMVNSTNTTLSVSGLSQNVAYEFYVRDSCGLGDVSAWAGPFTFGGEVVACDDFEVYSTGLVDAQSTLIEGWAGAGGDAEISTDFASSGTQSLKIHDGGSNGVSDVIADVGLYDTGIWNVAFDVYVPSTYGGYYNVLHNYQGSGTNVWAIEVTLDANGTATVEEGTNGSATIGTYNYNVGAWNTIEHFIDLENDTAWILVNGMATNVGWQFSLGSTNFGDQFNAVNFYSTAPAGQTPLIYFDDFCITEHLDDVASTALLEPAGPCGDSTSALVVEITNRGMNDLSNIPVVVEYSNGISGTFTNTYTGTLQAGESAIINMGMINTYSGGSFDFTAYTQLSGDQQMTNDTLSTTVTFDAIPVASSQFGSQCVDTGDMVQIIPDNSAWYYFYYDGNGNLIGTGDTLTLGPLSADIEIYAEAINDNPSLCAGPRMLMGSIGLKPGPIMIQQEPEPCFAEPARILVVDVPGGVWSGAGITDPNAGIFDPGTAGVGTHQITYTVTAPNGCTDFDTMTIVVNASPDATISGPDTICLNNGTFDFMANSPGGTWTGPGIMDPVNGTFVPDSAGVGIHMIIYDIDFVGCADVDTFYITVNPTDDPTISTLNNFYCSEDDAFKLSAATSGGVWAGTGVTGDVFDPAAAGVGMHWIYYTVTNSYGCVTKDSVEIDVRYQPDAAITGPASVCWDNGIVTFTAADAGGSWTGNGITNASAGTFDPQVAGYGTHTVTYSISMNGCGDVETHNITVNQLPDATITPVGPFCQDAPAITLTAATSGGTWSGPGISGNQFDPSTANVGNNTITYTVTDANGCSATATTTIMVYANPSFVISSAGPFCENDPMAQITATVGGGYWAGPGIVNPYMGTFNPANAGVGTHTISYTVININGCTTTNSIQVTVNPAPDATIAAAGPFCFDGQSVQLTAATNGGVWTGTGVTSGGMFNPASAGAGMHTVIYTVGNTFGCTNADTMMLEVTSPVSIFADVNNVTCEDGNDGSVEILNIGGGTAPYSYMWSNGATSKNVFGLSSGSHTLTVTDALGCTYVETYTVGTVSAMTINSTVQDATSQNNPTGSIDITVTGGSTPYAYAWSNGANSEDITGLAPGIYDVTVRDANGCTTSMSFTVEATFGTGVDNSILEASLSLYPNPTSNLVNIEIDLGTTEDLRIEVMDALGRTVYNTHDVINGSYSTTIDMNDHAAGQYLIRFRVGDQVLTKQVVLIK